MATNWWLPDKIVTIPEIYEMTEVLNYDIV